MSHAFFRDVGVDSVELVRPCKPAQKITPQMAEDLLECIEILTELQEDRRVIYRDRAPVVLRMMIEHYRQVAVGGLARSKQFRDDMLVWLRAMAIVCDTAGHASTHAEKNARLRGITEVIEGAISGLRGQRFELDFSAERLFDDVFRSDYPTRELINRIRELEAERDALKKSLEPTPPDAPAVPQDEPAF